MAKILLVEDDKSLREIYGVRLMAEGYTIVSAGDGEEALAVAIKERPDLIVSDVMMPKISGFDMLDILRSTTETKNIKVIMMTALSSEDQRARGEALGADRYLVKSQVGIEDVVRTVHDVLGDNLTSAAPTPDFSQPAPVTAAPIDVPTPAPLPLPTPVVEPAPQPMPAPIEPVIAAPAPYVAPIEPVTEPAATIAPVAPIAPIAFEQPVINTPAAPAPYQAPVAPAPYQVPVAPAPAPTPMPAPTAPAEPVFIPVSPAPVAPEPVMPAPAAYAPYTPPAPAPYTPPAPTVTLPEPTAPFSSPRPASLGDRVINPLPSAESLGQPGATDIATQMNQELTNHLQGLSPVEAPVQTPQQPPAPQLPPFPPQPTV